MDNFGGTLREAREGRGISLRQISAATKISIAALEALERNDVSKLPGGIFSRAFVRSYASEVGLDPEQTVREFVERFQSEPVAATSARAVSVPAEESNFESQQRMAGVLLKLVLLSLPLAGVILYFTMRSRAPEPSAEQRPTVETSASPAVSRPAESPVPQPAAPVASAPVAVLPAANQPMMLEIHPTGTCWVNVTVDGERVLSRLMQAGEKETRQIRQSAVITVGDAGTFAFSIDGHPGRALGESGQVRTARITRETLALYVQ